VTHCEVADSSSVHSRQTIGLLIAAIVVNATKDYDWYAETIPPRYCFGAVSD
jgi:hypothetical protein